MNLELLEKWRSTEGFMPSNRGDTHGFFEIPSMDKKRPFAKLRVLAAQKGMEWEHVSVSLQHRIPTWAEMCKVKDLFWDEDEVVVQYHPRKEDYVNNHQHCLHLWRHVDMITPPTELVGVKGVELC